MKESLEEIIKKIKCLKTDLAAGTYIPEHYTTEYGAQYVCDGWSTGSRYVEGLIDVLVPARIEPDVEKRSAAENELKRIYDSSEWYSARYKAGRALDLPKHQLKGNLRRWKATLERDFMLPKNAGNMQKISKAKEDMKGLGYSSMGLFAVRHPIAATVAAGMAVYGAGYALVQYMCK